MFHVKHFEKKNITTQYNVFHVKHFNQYIVILTVKHKKNNSKYIP